MALSWGKRRKFLYTTVFGLGAAIVILFAYELFFTAAPTCFDNTQDGSEIGVDCGGSCALICPITAKEPTVSWARSFATGGNYYTAASYLNNPNAAISGGSKGVRYAFQLFDADNSLIVERDGIADIPPVAVVPIIEPNIYVGNRVVSHTLFSFLDSTFIWQRFSGQVPQLPLSQLSHSDNYDKVSATLSNNSVSDVKKITVTAVLFDGDGVARAASLSHIAVVPRKSSQLVVFTFPGGVPNIVRAEITVLPSI